MKKVYVYPVVGVFPAVVVGLVTIFALHHSIFIGVLEGILAGLCGLIIARLVFAVVMKDLYDSFIASEVWMTIGTGLFGWFIYNQSSAIQTTLVFGIMCAAVNGFGFRFIAEKKEVVVQREEVPVVVKEPSRKDKIIELASTLRYRFMEDGVTPNLDAPLCVDEDGRHLTPAEADEKGLGALYAEAIEYIKSIVK